MKEIVFEVLNDMAEDLSVLQLKKLQEVLLKRFEEEDHILKSPIRRIHKIKTKTSIMEDISDEDIEKLRDSSNMPWLIRTM